MKICIYGAGAIGGYMAAMLKRGGADVSLIARGAHLDAIRRNGIKLLMDGAEIVERMPATSNPEELGVQDYVIVTLKAHQAWEVAEDMVPLLGRNTAVVTAQNGLPWWYFHGLDSTWPASGSKVSIRITVNGTRSDPRGSSAPRSIRPLKSSTPASSEHIYGNQFGLGEPDRSNSARVSRLAAAMEAGGLKTRFYEDIRNDIWVKLWGNLCFNPISALTGATLDVVATDPGTRTLARNMMVEAQAIGEKFGATFRVDVERRIDGAAGVGAHRTSMLQDVDKGRPIELDALLTSVQEMGRLSSMETPFIDSVLALAQQMGRVKGLYPSFHKVVVAEPAMAS